MGEAGPEVILPLSKPDRANSLLSRAVQIAPSIAKGLPMPKAEGGIIGMSGNSSNTFHVGSPSITINGNVDAAQLPAIQAALTEANDELVRDIERKLARSAARRWV